MKTTVLIGITAISLSLLGCAGNEHKTARRDTPVPGANGPTTSSTQHGTLLQGSSYDNGNQVGQR